jgi:hypothetical protein
VTVATDALPGGLAALAAALGQRKVFVLDADNGLRRYRPPTPRTPAVPLAGRTINLGGDFGGAYQELRLFASPLAANAGSPATLQLGMSEEEAFEAVEEEEAGAAGADGGESDAEAAADKPDTPPPPRAGGVRTRSLTVRARSLTAAEAAATRSN